MSARRPRRLAVLLVGCALASAAAGLVARPALRACSPWLAVHVEDRTPSAVGWRREHGFVFTGSTADPWGRPWRLVILDGERRLVLQSEPGGLVVADGRNHWPVRERNRGPRELFPVPTRFGYQQYLVPYSVGPDGVDGGTEGDDVIVRPWSLASAREVFLFEALGAADLVGGWLAAAWVWTLAAVRLCARREGGSRWVAITRRAVAVVTLAALAGLAVSFFEERWGLRAALPELHAEASARRIVAPAVAAFASLLLPGLLLVAWASTRGAPCGRLQGSTDPV